MHKVLLVILSSLLLGGCTISNPFLKKPAGLEIATVPSAEAFLNGDSLGPTPLTRADLPPGDYSLRLVPQDSSLPSWDTNLSLKPEVTTIVNKTFAAAETDSSSYTLELQPDPGGTFLSVVSDPATVNLDIDGQPSGYTPVTKLPLSPGAHSLHLTSPGYHPIELGVNVVKDYNLVVIAKLPVDTITLTSPAPASTSATLPTASPLASSGPQVVILETGTGWLRVRQDPSSSAPELGKVNVGEKLPYLGQTSDTGWHQVEFEGQTGWLSAKYSTLLD